MFRRTIISVLMFGLALTLAFSVFAQDQEGQPFLGISFGQDDAGAVVTRVMPGSPAADADLQRGDIITAIGNDAVTADSLRGMIEDHAPGDTLDLTVLRDGESMHLSVTLGTRPAQPGRGQPPTGRPPQNFDGDFFSFNGSTWTIQGLTENHPLYEAGLREGDEITAINGESYDPRALQEYLSGLADDDTVTVTAQRDGNEMTFDVLASALRSLARFGFGFGGEFPFGAMPFGAFGGSRLGVTFMPLDAQVAQEHNLDVTDGALIVEVVPGSPAEDAGLQADDVVTAVNHEAVDEEHTLADRLVAYEPGDAVTLSVLRGADTQEIEVTLGQPEMPSDFMPFFGPNGGFFDFQAPGTPQQPEAPQANQSNT